MPLMTGAALLDQNNPQLPILASRPLSQGQIPTFQQNFHQSNLMMPPQCHLITK